MLEHSIGVGITMTFLLKQSKVKASEEFSLLMKHPRLILARAQEHDLSKFKQTPDFVKKYYPKNAHSPLSAPVFRYYGLDIRSNPSELSQNEVQEAKNAFKALNKVDHQLLEDLVNTYSKDKDLSVNEIHLLIKQLDRFEHMADILNRKLFENIMRFRRNFSNQGRREVLEFGRPIDLLSTDPHHWAPESQSKELALEFYYSPSLRVALSSIDPTYVVKSYLRFTRKSPFVYGEQRKVKAQTLKKYLVNRAHMQETEKKVWSRKWRASGKLEIMKLYTP